jgi:hypothetical protein
MSVTKNMHMGRLVIVRKIMTRKPWARSKVIFGI